MRAKNDILEKLRSFREAYSRWMYSVDDIMKDVENGKIVSPEDYAEYKFEKWIKKNRNLLCCIDIEHQIIEKYIEVHLKYSEILDLMINETISDFVYYSPYSEKKLMFFNAKINSLRNYSKNMIDALDSIIQKIEPLNEHTVQLLTSYNEISYN